MLRHFPPTIEGWLKRVSQNETMQGMTRRPIFIFARLFYFGLDVLASLRFQTRFVQNTVGCVLAILRESWKYQFQNANMKRGNVCGCDTRVCQNQLH